MSEWSLMKRLVWFRKYNGGGVPGVKRTVTGTSPLTLLNAVAGKLVSLIQTGKCTQSATPAPDAPADIVCNNGTLQTVDDELPSGYDRIAGIAFDSSVYYQITDFFLKGSDTIRISFSVEKACNVFGCYTTTSATNNYSLYASTAANAKYMRYAGGTYKSQFASSTFGKRFDVVITPTGSSGMPSGQNDTWSEVDFTATSALCIAHTSPSGTSSKLDGNIYGNIVVDGRLKLVPCIRTNDSAIGYYDTYTKTFYAPVTGTPASLGYDPSHLALDVVGTPEVLTVGGQTASAVDLFAVEGFADTQDIISGEITRRMGVLVLDGTENWNTGGASVTYFYNSMSDIDQNAEDELICTHYPTTTRNTLTVGTVCIRNGRNGILFSTPYGTTMTEWTTYLAAQYAQGTPVIVLYPLATPKTEVAGAQPLFLSAGVNVLEVNANVSDIQLSVTYMAQE